jgi:hypothetical protein
MIDCVNVVKIGKDIALLKLMEGVSLFETTQGIRRHHEQHLLKRITVYTFRSQQGGSCTRFS